MNEVDIFKQISYSRRRCAFGDKNETQLSEFQTVQSNGLAQVIISGTNVSDSHLQLKALGLRVSSEFFKRTAAAYEEHYILRVTIECILNKQ